MGSESDQDTAFYIVWNAAPNNSHEGAAKNAGVSWLRATGPIITGLTKYRSRAEAEVAAEKHLYNLRSDRNAHENTDSQIDTIKNYVIIEAATFDELRQITSSMVMARIQRPGNY